VAQTSAATQQPASKQKLSELAKAEERTAWWLLLPSLAILVLIAIYPLGQVFVSSFTNARFASDEPTRFVGFDNYRQLLTFRIVGLEPELDDQGRQLVEDGQPAYENSRLKLANMFRNDELVFINRSYDENGQVVESRDRYDSVFSFGWFGQRYVLAAPNADFVRAVGDTIWFTVITVALETLLGMIIALSLNKRFFGRDLMRTAMLVPWAIITVVSGLIWEWMYRSDRSGFFNALTNRLGFSDGNTSFLTETALQMPSVIAIDVWKTTPFMALLLLAGLSTIPKELYEAARVDGANQVRQFFSVTLPLLAPTLAVALIFRTLDALRVFDLFQIIFGESRYSMASFAQDTLISNRDVGLSSASSVVIFIIIFAFAIFYIRVLGVDSD
jgi:trehalose/maltose transport system permease protein